ncbi:MAG: hypothetical protein WA958_16155 [Tunicatimonas sp.]
MEQEKRTGENTKAVERRGTASFDGSSAVAISKQRSLYPELAFLQGHTDLSGHSGKDITSS